MLKPILAALAAAAFLAACSEGGDAEQAGENLDSAFEEATQGEEKLGDGPLERAGENIDGAEKNNDPADALNDATDGDPSTRP